MPEFLYTEDDIYNVEFEATITPQICFQHVFVRNLVQDFHHCFFGIREDLNEFNGDKRELTEHWIEEYTSAIGNAMRVISDSNVDIEVHFYNLFFKMAKVYLLTSSLCVKAAQGAFAQPYIVKWLDYFLDGIEASEQGEDMKNNFKSALLRGKSDRLLELLNWSDMGLSRPQKEILMGLVEKMPDYSRHDIAIRFDEWSNECKLKKRSSEYSKAQEHDYDFFLTCIDIMCGDAEAIADNSTHWEQQIAAHLTYNTPTVKVAECRLFFEQLEDMGIFFFGDDKGEEGYYEIIKCIFCNDILSSLEKIANFEKGCSFIPIFSTHLADLLVFTKHPSLHIDPEQFRKDRLLDFAKTLLGDQEDGLWQIGASYLKFCDNKGKDTYKTFIENVVMKKNDHHAEVLLKLCEDFGLHEEYLALCVRIGQEAESEGNLSKALMWYWKGKNHDNVVITINKMLTKCEKSQSGAKDIYCLVGKFCESDFLAYPKLRFLDQYCKLCFIIENIETVTCENLENAVDCIVFLINDVHVRSKLIIILLDFLWTVLVVCKNKNFKIFTLDHCHIILNGLQELESNPLYSAYAQNRECQIKPEQIPEFIEKVRRGINYMLAQVY